MVNSGAVRDWPDARGIWSLSLSLSLSLSVCLSICTCMSTIKLPINAGVFYSNTELSEYQPYTSYVIATPALSADTDNSLFLVSQA